MIQRRLGALSALYVVAILAVALGIGRLGDAWWPATAMLFAPRWIWGAPLVVLVPLAIRRDRAALLPLAAAAIVLLGPILDLRLPFRRLGRLGGPPRDLRVMTYNIGGGRIDPRALTALVAEIGPDVVAFQEREGDLSLGRMNTRCRVGLCFGSRFPIRRDDEHPSGAFARYEIMTPRGIVNVTNVHLPTPRSGIAEVMRRGPRGAPALDAITAVRRVEAEAARAWALREPGPTIVMGDFNTPVESAIYRASWSSFENAFSTVGFGFGATKHTRWHGVRIDHVLASAELQVVRAWVGPGLGGDHRPMIADLRFIEREPQ